MGMFGRLKQQRMPHGCGEIFIRIKYENLAHFVGYFVDVNTVQQSWQSVLTEGSSQLGKCITGREHWVEDAGVAKPLGTPLLCQGTLILPGLLPLVEFLNWKLKLAGIYSLEVHSIKTIIYNRLQNLLGYNALTSLVQRVFWRE